MLSTFVQFAEIPRRAKQLLVSRVTKNYSRLMGVERAGPDRCCEILLPPPISEFDDLPTEDEQAITGDLRRLSLL